MREKHDSVEWKVVEQTWSLEFKIGSGERKPKCGEGEVRGLDSQARKSRPSPVGEKSLKVFKLVSDKASHGTHKYVQS